ncbi:hypothetical protein NDU88_005558 [Pleurodeles waltl]|uniref:Uncharacterized protein n=1 Tax=Pleurodeles waltl TaxID=8319 RepID=A0AAV7QIF9_PLEWA|nr:hypothetical protein NDU88_005558 [Pleurodeles waltl]
MSAADRNHFERRAMRYRHILQVQCGYRRMACKYHSDRASGAWWATPQAPPTLPPTATNTTSTRSPQVAPATSGTIDPGSSSRPGPSRVGIPGQSSGQPTPATTSTSAGTQTTSDPPVDPAAFLALTRKMDKLVKKVDNLREDMGYIKKRVRSIRRTLRRANL